MKLLERRKLKNLLLVCLSLLLIGMIGILGGCAPEEPVEEPAPPEETEAPEEPEAPTEEPIVLEAVTFLDPGSRQGQWFQHVLDAIEDEMGDKITVDYLGGPEAIPGYELGEAIDRGIVDFCQLSFSWLQDRYPEAQVAGGLFPEFSPAEQRDMGVNEFLNDGLSEAGVNVHYLGMMTIGYETTLYVNFPVEDIDDLEGKIVRTSPLHRIAAESLGMEAMITAPGELFSALERGVVEGYFWPAYISDLGLHEITDSRIKPGFGGSDAAVLINTEVWGKIPAELRDDFQETIDNALDDYYNNIMPEEVEKEEEILEEHGIETIEFPEEYRNIQLEGYKTFAEEEFGEDFAEEFFEKFFGDVF